MPTILNLESLHEFISQHTTTPITVRQLGATFHCVVTQPIQFAIFAELCYTFDCDAHYITRDAHVDVHIQDAKTKPRIPTVNRNVKRRVKKLIRTLTCGATMRQRAEAIMLSICGFSTVHFMPNFTFETRTSRDPRESGLAIICNMAHMHVLDVARLTTDHTIDNLRYSRGYLQCELLPPVTLKRGRDSEDTRDSARRRVNPE